MLRLRSLALGMSAALLLIAKVSPSPNNILLIIADDLGWSDISLAGINRTGGSGGHAEFATPNIDALARDADSVVLDQYYVNRLCSPTRSSLISGP